MDPVRKKRVTLAFTGLLLLACVVVVSRSILSRNQTGSAGMVFLPAHTSATKIWVPIPHFTVRPGGVVMVFPGSPADKAGIQAEDAVLGINGVPIHEEKRLQELAARSKVGDIVTYRIRRSNRELSVPLGLETPLKSKLIDLSLGSNVLVGLTFFVIGLFVYWRKSEDRRAFVFYLVSAVAAVLFLNYAAAWEQMDALGSQQSALSVNRVITTAFGFAAILFFPLLLHLSLVFPKERPIVESNPYIFRWAYAPLILLPPCTFAAIMVVTFASAKPKLALAVIAGVLGLLCLLFLRLKKAIRAEGWKRWFLLRPFSTLLLSTLAASLVFGLSSALIGMFHLPKGLVVAVFVLGIGAMTTVVVLLLVAVYPVATCLALWRSYRESGLEQKKQVQWPLWGTIVAIAGPVVLGIVTWGLVAILGFGRVVSSPVMMGSSIFSKAFYLLIPISFAFAILKYRLMDIDLVIKKTILYTLLSSFILVAYLGLAGGLGGLLVKFAGVKSNSIAILSTLAVAAIFVPVRTRVQGFVDRRFFRKKYNYAEALRILSHQTLRAADRQILLQLVAEHLQQALQNRVVVIFSKAARDQAFWASGKVGVPDEVLGRLKFDAASALLSMMDRIFEVPRKDLPEEDRLKLRKVGSALIAPVKLKDELIGFISLGSKLSDQEYDAEDIGFLAAVADQTAVGIESLRLHRQEEEFEEAREIQQGLLPSTIPQIPGYDISGAWQPARVVAGDYFDVFKLSESKVALCVADVMGKGMPAALLMSNLQATVKAFASDGMPPKELCRKINRVISSNTGVGRFISFFYGLLDAEQERLVYANAGHNAPILQRRDGTVIRLEEGGAVLGIFPDGNYEQGEVELGSGDSVLLFTDGVTEVRNAAEEEFGEERLIGLLAQNREFSAAEVQKRLLEAVTEFSQGNFQDDATLVVMSVE